MFAAMPRKMLPNSLRRLSGRIPEGVPSNKIVSFDLLGTMYGMERAISARKDEAESVEIFLKYNKKFNNLILKSNYHDCDAIYGFNSASCELFQDAKARGVFTILEQTIAPKSVERQIILKASRENKLWALRNMEHASIDAFCERETREWELADLIVCGSEFVRNAIGKAHGPVDRTVVVPYGVKFTDSSFFSKHANRGPLRVLTVGTVGLRKGSHIVAKIAGRLKGKCEFRMVGPISCPSEALQALQENVEVRGSIPRAEMADQYAWADIFLLPSLCEGSATVTYEAMLAGLPVICSPNTGSLVQGDVSGFIIDPDDIDQYVQRLDQLSSDRSLCLSLSDGARQTSALCSFESYKERLVKTVKSAAHDIK